MKKQLVLLLILSCSILPCASGFDLLQSYQAAVSYNADYLRQIATNQAYQEMPNIASSKLLPQIGANVALTENYFEQLGMHAWYHQPTYGATLSQAVIDFTKFAKLTQNKLIAGLSDIQLVNAQQQLMVTVAQAYFDVLYAEDKLLASQMTKKSLKTQLDQAQLAFEAGSVTIADVNDAKSGYDTASAQELQDTNDLIFKKNIFHNITGLNADNIQPIEEKINLETLEPNSDESWAKFALQSNLNIKIANAQTNIAKEQISIARSGHYPSLNLNAQYTYQDTSTLDSTNIPASFIPMLTYPGGPLSNYGVASVLLNLSIPIFAGGGINAQIRQEAESYNATVQQQVAVERNINQEVRNAYWRVTNGIDLVKAQQTALNSAKVKLDSDKLGYEVGLRNSVDLVSSEKNYYETFQLAQQSKYQYLMAKVNLFYLSGKINLDFLKSVNTDIKQ